MAVPSPVTRGARGSSAAASASSTISRGSSIPRFTAEAMYGRPAKRLRSRTSTSVAKITASARAITCGSRRVAPEEPCVSTCRSTPISCAVLVNASAAM